jgi:hypothetical protein
MGECRIPATGADFHRSTKPGPGPSNGMHETLVPQAYRGSGGDWDLIQEELHPDRAAQQQREQQVGQVQQLIERGTTGRSAIASAVVDLVGGMSSRLATVAEHLDADVARVADGGGEALEGARQASGATVEQTSAAAPQVVAGEAAIAAAVAGAIEESSEGNRAALEASEDAIAGAVREREAARLTKAEALLREDEALAREEAASQALLRDAAALAGWGQGHEQARRQVQEVVDSVPVPVPAPARATRRP